MASKAIFGCLKGKPEAKLVLVTVHSPSHTLQQPERHADAG
jgi:hypothetical protein